MQGEKWLIDANELKRRMIAFATGVKSDFLSIDAIIDRIDTAQTVDAMEVVRCKDCTYWKRHTKTDKFYGACSRCRITKHENGYCEKGERRNDNEE